MFFFCTRRWSAQPFNNYIFPQFLHSRDHQHPDRLQVFQEEVPRAKARQQLREAQNNDASRGLSEETGWLQDSTSTEPTNSSTSSIRGEIIPMHYNLFSLNPPKNIKKPSSNGDSICPLQPTPQFCFPRLLRWNLPTILLNQVPCVTP